MVEQCVFVSVNIEVSCFGGHTLCFIRVYILLACAATNDTVRCVSRYTYICSDIHAAGRIKNSSNFKSNVFSQTLHMYQICYNTESIYMCFLQVATQTYNIRLLYFDSCLNMFCCVLNFQLVLSLSRIKDFNCQFCNVVFNGIISPFNRLYC